MLCAYFYDYAGKLTAARERQEQVRRAEVEASDQAMRDELKMAVLGFSMSIDGNDQ